MRHNVNERVQLDVVEFKRNKEKYKTKKEEESAYNHVNHLYNVMTTFCFAIWNIFILIFY